MAANSAWDAEKRRLQKHVDRVGASIRTHGMSCVTGVAAVNAYLVPQLELGMRIIPHSAEFMKTLTDWRNALQDDILIAQGAWLTRPNREAFCEVTGMVDLPRFMRRKRAAVTIQRLNFRDEYLPPTAWDRLTAARPGASRRALLDFVNRRKRPSGNNRVLDALVGHGLGRLHLETALTTLGLRRW